MEQLSASIPSAQVWQSTHPGQGRKPWQVRTPWQGSGCGGDGPASPLDAVCSAYESTMEALQQPTIRVVAVIAEGVPEQDTKKLIAYARAHNKIILGPATVGGLQVRSCLARFQRACACVDIHNMAFLGSAVVSGIACPHSAIRLSHVLTACCPTLSTIICWIAGIALLMQPIVCGLVTIGLPKISPVL